MFCLNEVYTQWDAAIKVWRHLGWTISMEVRRFSSVSLVFYLCCASEFSFFVFKLALNRFTVLWIKGRQTLYFQSTLKVATLQVPALCRYYFFPYHFIALPCKCAVVSDQRPIMQPTASSDPYWLWLKAHNIRDQCTQRIVPHLLSRLMFDLTFVC